MSDLIMLNLKMPGMLGWDVMKAIRGNGNLRGTPAAIITAYPEGNEQKRAKSVGARNLLSKTSSVKELMEHVRLVIEKKRKSPQAPRFRTAKAIELPSHYFL